MKVVEHDDEFKRDNEEENIDTVETDENKRDSLEKYNDEMARDALDSLYDTGEIDLAEEDMPVRKKTPRISYRPRAERAVGPRVQDLIDEGGEDAPPRRRDRTHEANPEPKPAVKVTPPYRERRPAARPAPSRYEYDDIYEDEADMEDEMDAFRGRYKPSPKREEGRPRPRPETRTEPYRRSDRLNYGEPVSGEDADSVPLLRVLGIIAVVALLGITVYFAFRVSSLSEELNAANALIASQPADDGFNETIAKERIDELEKNVAELEAENEALQSESRPPVFGPDTTPDPNVVTNPGDDGVAAEGEEAPPAPTENQSYTAVSGDNLSKISIKFYGNANPSNIQKIKDANNKTGDGVQLGEVFIIPPQ